MGKRSDNELVQIDKLPIANNEGGILVRLYRGLIRKKNLGGYRLLALINEYGRKNGNNELSGTTQSRSSMVKLLKDGSISFKSFINIIFNLLKVTRIRIDITCYWADDDYEKVSLSFRANEVDPGEEEEEDEKGAKDGKRKK